MPERSADWLAQARRDLEHAEKDVTDEYYEHACFEAQQAAEKAVKAVYMRHHAEGWGHRVSALLGSLDELGVEATADLVEAAKLLDQYYIPTRYPNGFESGAPKDYYTEEQARDACAKSRRIVEWCANMARA